MTDSYIEEKAVEMMIATSAAVQKIRFYPPSSTLTGYSVNEAYQHIQDIFVHKNDFIIAKSENSILICDNYLSEKEQNKIQVSSFLDLLFGFGFVSITFKKGLEKEEFTILLEILSEKPEQIKKEGGIQQVFARKNLSHICLDECHPVSSSLSRTPVWEKDKKLDRKVIAVLIHLLDTLLDDKDKENISQILARSVISKDDDTIAMFLMQEKESDLGKQIQNHIIILADNKKFETLLLKIRYMYDGGDTDEAVRKIYDIMMNSDKGIPFRKKTEDEKMLFKEKLNRFIKGEKELFKDKLFMESLSETAEKFFIRKNSKAAEAVINKLGDGLTSEDPDVRDDISRILAQIGEKLVNEQKINIFIKLSWKLIRWIHFETRLTPEYETICIQLQNISRFLIMNNRFPETHQILKLFNIIYSGKAKKDENIRELAGKVLTALSADDILDPILKDFQNNEAGRRKQASEKLVHLGAASAKRMLNLLRESENKTERSRILRVLSDMKYAVIIPLTEQIKEDIPWYYLRNLILLFGRVGNENHLEILSPFLKYKEMRVRRETLNSIWSIGGKKSEAVLLAALLSADDLFKINIISTLGAMKCEDAVSHFASLLESMSSVQSAELRTELAKNICAALGNIGNHDATMILTEIFEQRNKKLLLNKKMYNEESEKICYRSVGNKRRGSDY